MAAILTDEQLTANETNWFYLLSAIEYLDKYPSQLEVLRYVVTKLNWYQK